MRVSQSGTRSSQRSFTIRSASTSMTSVARTRSFYSRRHRRVLTSSIRSSMIRVLKNGSGMCGRASMPRARQRTTTSSTTDRSLGRLGRRKAELVLGRWRQQRRWPRSKSSNMQDKRETDHQRYKTCFFYCHTLGITDDNKTTRLG